MTGQQPELHVGSRTGGASAADLRALAALQTYAAGELTRIQGRSEKWIAGLTAITGVLTTAIVIKGPETFTKMVDTVTVGPFSFPPASAVIALMVLGGFFIGLGIYKAYVSAHGDPTTGDALMVLAEQYTAEGAFGKYLAAMKSTAATARKALKRAVQATIVGTLLLAAAVVVTWTAPSKAAAAGEASCFLSGTQVVKVEGSPPVVVVGSLTVVPCP